MQRLKSCCRMGSCWHCLCRGDSVEKTRLQGMQWLTLAHLMWTKPMQNRQARQASLPQ